MNVFVAGGSVTFTLQLPLSNQKARRELGWVPGLFSVSYRTLGSTTEADDVQDVWLRYAAVQPQTSARRWPNDQKSFLRRHTFVVDLSNSLD
jgi:hypothetical protein